MIEFEITKGSGKIDFNYDTKSMTFDFSLSGGSGSDVPDYDGDYSVIPKVKEQFLNTKGKKMLRDVTVFKIPTEETHNEHGTTFTIGGIL